jgi:hypothetical protein
VPWNGYESWTFAKEQTRRLEAAEILYSQLSHNSRIADYKGNGNEEE